MCQGFGGHGAQGSPPGRLESSSSAIRGARLEAVAVARPEAWPGTGQFQTRDGQCGGPDAQACEARLEPAHGPAWPTGALRAALSDQQQHQ